MHGGNARGCLVPVLVVAMLALSGCAGLPFGGDGGDGQPDGRIGPYERVENPGTLTADPPTTDTAQPDGDGDGPATETPAGEDESSEPAPGWYPPGVTNDSVGPSLARAHVQVLSEEYFVVTENVSYRYPGSAIEPSTERRRISVTPEFAVVERDEWTTFLNDTVSYERYGGGAETTYLQANGTFATSTFAQYATLRTVFEAGEWRVAAVQRDQDGDRVLVLQAERIVDASAVAEQFGIPWLDEFSGTVTVATDGFVRSASMNLSYSEGAADRQRNLSVEFARYGYIDVPRPEWVATAAEAAIHVTTTVDERGTEHTDSATEDETSGTERGNVTNGTVVSLAVESGAAVPAGSSVMLSNRTSVWSTTLDSGVESGESFSVVLTPDGELVATRDLPSGDSPVKRVAHLDGSLSLRILDDGRLLVSRELDAGPLVD